MSRVKTYGSLGVLVKVTVPDNPFPPGTDENLIFESGIDGIVYRSGDGLPAFRENFAEQLEKLVGVEPELKVKKNSKGEDVKDEDGNVVQIYAKQEAERVDIAVAKSGRAIESFQDLADSISTQFVKFNPKATERGPAKPKTPPKTVYAQVDEVIKQGQATAVAASLSSLLGRTVETDRESLARAVHEYQLEQIRKAKSSLPGVA